MADPLDIPPGRLTACADAILKGREEFDRPDNHTPLARFEQMMAGYTTDDIKQADAFLARLGMGRKAKK